VLTPGQTLPLDIDKPAAGGRMIARADGQVVLVSGAIPGERARVRIARVAKGVAYGDAVAIEAASPDRREPGGDPLCGGSLYAHICYPRQLALKSQIIADALARIGRVPWPAPIAVAASPEDGYRMRARVHLRGGRIGFFREASHEPCDARLTRQLLMSTCDALDEIGAKLTALQIAAEIELAENLAASDRVVHLETSAAIPPPLLAEVTRAAALTGVTVNGRHAGSPGVAVAAGDPHVRDVLSIDGHEIALRRHVLSFFQGNRFLLSELVSRVVMAVAEGDDVVDLYSGVGVFSVAAAMCRNATVTAVEGDFVAARDLAANAAPTGGRVAVVHRPVEDFVASHRTSPAAMIVDPPRTGMSKQALEGSIRLAPRRVIYVSCDAATFARDTRRLIDAGYTLAHIEALDLFPNTPHVETIAILNRD
jgi:23S rRNA (uracil1939-C5)-methyltransferase